MIYDISETDQNRIERDFVYHSPKGDQPERYEKIRAMGKVFATLVLESTPKGREQARALTAIEDACFCANAAIARGE